MDIFIPDPNPLILANVNIPRYIIRPELKSDDSVGTSYLGTPIMDKLILRYTVNQNTAVNTGNTTTKAQTDSITFETVLIEVSQSKNIVKTPVTGRQGGTVKEYINDGDYMIRITGAIVSQFSNYYPKEEVRQLSKLKGIPDALECVSDFLGYFNINSLVIENITISQKLGTRNMVPFEISAVSDKPIEFQLG